MTINLTHVIKSFGATRAVDDVSLTIERGEIVGLVGENGAGKTTLMRIVAGELDADGGTIVRDGAAELVHQHFMLVSELTIAENIALASRERFRIASGRRREREAEATIAATGIELRDVGRRVADLGVGEKAKLELIKAIARQPSLLILDEPTSVLTPAETAELFAVIRRLAAAGTAVVFISHKIPEVLAIATRIVVMRRGRIVATEKSMSAEELAKAMVDVGAPPADREPRTATPAAVVLRCEQLSGQVLDHLSLDVRGGETVAIIGVAGNGQSELAAMLRGIVTPRSGRIGAPPRMAHIPEDRTRDGLVAELSIAENIALAERRWRPADATRRARRLIELYSIRAEAPTQRAGDLSGGNQQKVILARELERQPEVVVAAEPTRGLDVEATRFVHAQLRHAAARGAAILLITSDLDEAFALADAIHVIYRGRLSDRMTPAEAATRAAALMAGVA